LQIITGTRRLQEGIHRQSWLPEYISMASIIQTNGRKYTENYWAERPQNIQNYTDERTLQ